MVGVSKIWMELPPNHGVQPVIGIFEGFRKKRTTIYQNMYNDLLRIYLSMLNFMKCRYLPIYSLALH